MYIHLPLFKCKLLHTISVYIVLVLLMYTITNIVFYWRTLTFCWCSSYLNKDNIATTSNKTTINIRKLFDRDVQTVSPLSLPLPIMCINADGRIGNLIFKLASLLGIAKKTDHSPILTERFRELQKLFPNLSIPFNKQPLSYKRVHEKDFGKYLGDKNIRAIPKNLNIMLIGYFQSWIYFNTHQKLLRQEFILNTYTIKQCQQYLYSIKLLVQSQYLLSNATMQSMSNVARMADLMVFIGVHIRKTDMATNSLLHKGFLTASSTYIHRAMQYFIRMYQYAQFIIVTDDLTWINENIDKKNNIHFPSVARQWDYDMALLSVCNHTIMTTGTFGWWGAWLAGGSVIYYSTPFNTSLPLSKHYSIYDYFLPSWIAMSD